MVVTNKYVKEWVDEMALLTQPDNIVWLNGSLDEKKKLEDECLATGELVALNESFLPGCFYHRTAANDVARVEDRTFICSKTKEEAGPTNNWMDPAEMYAKLTPLFAGSMKGRTMYVLPYIMGPAGSPLSKVGVELTDSKYVVLNMRIMTRMGDIAWKQLGDDAEFVKGLHSKADIDAEKRYIAHFPQDYTIWSVNSGYGGNVILAKKCFALRIASVLAKEQDWMAEHMLVLGIENVATGKTQYITGAFPSACGKTNLAMLIPPAYAKGYKVYTVGDDIAWMRPFPDGHLYAINPENGFFGVAPGTSMESNPNALLTTKSNTIFTNVALTDDKNVWWYGMGVKAPAHMIDWLGNDWNTGDNEKNAANPNSRFTAPASQCPCISPEWEDPQGVPISAILFGGRRAKTAPLVYQSFDWNHGVFVGATMASETTAAAAGQVGVVRRDPMAMKPFIGYNAGDYFAHWLHMGTLIKHKPLIFNVNWFRTDENGKFIWPGYGDNFRVLEWILKRCNNEVDAQKTPIGYIPYAKDIDLTGLDGFTAKDVDGLLSIEKKLWEEEIAGIVETFAGFDRLPEELNKQLADLKARFAAF
jgi:phosphoenolpyruvate carboxykinase (GTP)